LTTNRIGALAQLEIFGKLCTCRAE